MVRLHAVKIPTTDITTNLSPFLYPSDSNSCAVNGIKIMAVTTDPAKNPIKLEIKNRAVMMTNGLPFSKFRFNSLAIINLELFDCPIAEQASVPTISINRLAFPQEPTATWVKVP